MRRVNAFLAVPVVAVVLATSLLGATRAGAATTGGISGQVTEVGGTALAHVVVTVSAVASPSQVLSTTLTNSSGKYAFGSLAAGNYDVCFDPSTATGGHSTDGYEAQCWLDKIVGQAPSPVPVAAGQTTVGIGAALHANGGVSGVVTDSAGNPLASATIQINPSVSTTRFTTHADGTYTATGLAPELTVVCATGPTTGGGPYGWAPKCWRADQTYYNPVLLLIKPGQITTGINFRLFKNGALAGTVTDHTGAPVASSDVTLHPLAVGGLDTTITTAAAGTFEFIDLAPGFYTVCAAKGALTSCWKATVAASATPVVVPQTVRVRGIAITLG